MSDRKSTREIAWQAGGVIVTSISTAGLVAAGVLTYLGAQPDGAVTRDVAATEARAEMCDAYFAYLADDTHREPESPAERRAIERMNVQNARACTIYDGRTPLADTRPAPDEGVSTQ